MLWTGDTALGVQAASAEPPVQNELAGHWLQDPSPVKPGLQEQSALESDRAGALA